MPRSWKSSVWLKSKCRHAFKLNFDGDNNPTTLRVLCSGEQCKIPHTELLFRSEAIACQCENNLAMSILQTCYYH